MFLDEDMWIRSWTSSEDGSTMVLRCQVVTTFGYQNQYKIFRLTDRVTVPVVSTVQR